MLGRHVPEYFGYSAGIFNGAGQNNLDNNTGKDLALRLEAYPVPGLLIGGVVYQTVGQTDEAGAKTRFEGDLRYEKDGFLAQAEYIYGRDVGTGGKAVKGHGFYVALAYALLDQKLQPAVRFGYSDPDTSQDLKAPATKDELMQVDVGLHYYLQKQEAKLLLDYYRLQYQDLTADNQLIFAAQVAF